MFKRPMRLAAIAVAGVVGLHPTPGRTQETEVIFAIPALTLTFSTHFVAQDAGGVDIGDAQLGAQAEALAFGHQVAELVNDPLAVPGEVGRALAVTRGRVDVGGSGT